MVQAICRKPDSYSAGHEIPHILWKRMSLNLYTRTRHPSVSLSIWMQFTP